MTYKFVMDGSVGWIGSAVKRVLQLRVQIAYVVVVG